MNKLKKGKVFLPFVFIILFYGLYSLIFFLIFKKSMCPIKLLAGIPCPLCGISRAALSLVKFDLTESFAYHPLLIPMLLFFVTGFLLYLFWDINLFANSKVWLVFCILLLAVYALRMILLFPNVAPMTLNKKALLFYLF